MIMAMRHGVLPRTLHVDRPSTHVDWSAGAVELLTEAREWTSAPGRPRRAGISSFGASGTNAHLILEQAPEEETAPDAADHEPAGFAGPVPWALSARSEQALRAQAEKLRDFVAADPQADLADIGASLVSSRSRFEHRAVALGGDRDELLSALTSLSEGAEVPAVVRGTAGELGGSVFMFPGQGAKWAGVARELYDTFPVFAQSLDEVCERFDAHLPFALKPLLLADEPEGHERTDVMQPALFALQVSLYRLLARHCPRPGHLIGHSVGEIAAAHVSGVFDLDTATRLVAARGRVMQSVTEPGAMLAVRASQAEVEALLGTYTRVGVAAVNGPESVVVSGLRDEVHDLRDRLVADGRSAKLLPVDHAFHSPLMDPVLEEFATALQALPGDGELSIPIVSTRTGREATLQELTSVEHWVDHVREPVRFHDAVERARAAGAAVFLEVGPGSTLAGLVKDAFAAQDVSDAVVLSTSRRGRAAAEALTGALAELHVRGGSVDWNALFGPRRPVDLPTYAFQRRRYWMDFLAGTQSADVASAGLTAPGHPLLGALVDHPGTDEVVFTDLWSLRTHDWLADHTVFDSVVVPATAYLDLALSVGEHVGCAAVEELSLEVPLILPETGDVQVRIAVGAADEAGRRSLDVYARPAEDAATLGGWTRHAMGTLAAGAPRPAERADDPRALAAWPPPGAERLDFDGLYDSLVDGGFDYGPTFRGLREVWRRGEDLFALATLPEGADGEFALHPALIDTVLHAVVVGDVITVTDDRGWMPFSWSGVHLAGQCGPTVRVRLTPTGEGVVALAVADEHGREIAHVDALTFRPATAEQVRSARGGREQSLYELQWRPAPRATPETGRGPWAVLGAHDGQAARLAEAGDGTAALHTCLDDALAGDAPRHVVLCLDDAVTAGPDPPHHRRHRDKHVLDLVQRFLAEERFDAATLVVLTRRARRHRRRRERREPARRVRMGPDPVRPDRTPRPVPPGGHRRRADLLGRLRGRARPRRGPGGAPRRRLPRAPHGPGRTRRPPAGAPGGRRAPAGHPEEGHAGEPDLGAVPRSGGTADRRAGPHRRHAAGLNFRDVTIALGLVDRTAVDAGLGTEGAGVVLEVADDVTGLAPGDRVTGIFSGAFGRVAVADHRLLMPVPDGWSLRRGGVDAGRLPHRLLRAVPRDAAREGPADPHPRRGRRRRHGRRPAGQARRRRGLRHREPRQVARSARAGPGRRRTWPPRATWRSPRSSSTPRAAEAWTSSSTPSPTTSSTPR